MPAKCAYFGLLAFLFLWSSVTVAEGEFYTDSWHNWFSQLNDPREVHPGDRLCYHLHKSTDVEPEEDSHGKLLPRWKGFFRDGQVTVGANGKITLPVIGKIQAADLPLFQIKEAALSAYRRNPAYEQCFLALAFPEQTIKSGQTQEDSVEIGGCVVFPRRMAWRERLTLFDALREAGGPDCYSTPRLIVLRRNSELPLFEVPRATGVPWRNAASWSNSYLNIKSVTRIDLRKPNKSLAYETRGKLLLRKGDEISVGETW